MGNPIQWAAGRKTLLRRSLRSREDRFRNRNSKVKIEQWARYHWEVRRKASEAGARMG
jgi:hypothetical protein